MKLHTLFAETFKLDGGACFGVVPQTIWGKAMQVDHLNRISICTRLLYIEIENRKIIIDTGTGSKQDEKFKYQLCLDGFSNLSNSLKQIDITPEQITDVIFTHLHFDHVGGATYNNETNQTPRLTFSNAQHWCSMEQLAWAQEGHSIRERASYLQENLPDILLKQLSFITEKTFSQSAIHFRQFNGHTPGQLIPFIHYKDNTIVYVADFIPSLAHIPLSYIAAYDTEPLVALDEKEQFLDEAVKNKYILLFQHDSINECCTLKQTEKGIRPAKVFTLNSL